MRRAYVGLHSEPILTYSCIPYEGVSCGVLRVCVVWVLRVCVVWVLRVCVVWVLRV